MAADGALKSREGEVWKQTQTEEDGGGELLWLVVSSPSSPPKGWQKVTHKVLVLEATGDNWVSSIKAGHETEMDEHREGWWDDLTKATGRMERVA